MPHASRPVFLNLLQIKMPVGALTSIAHRISGVVLAVGVPAAVYLLALSLRSEEGFEHALAFAGLLPAKVAVILLAWALAHHLLAGVRHMLSDVGIGSPLRVARKTAYLVNFGAMAFAALTAVLLPW
jgi:succinate dehydrogenase / fumarate reductase, cytochrome b subunit